MSIINVFTDGSSTIYKNKNNLKYGGIGILISGLGNDDYNLSIPLIGSDVTNQKAELLATIMAIKFCKQKIDNLNKIVLYSDSMYTINCATKWAIEWEKNGWKKKNGEILNLIYIKELIYLIKNINIEFKHVKSHQKKPIINDEKMFIWNGNNVVDLLAKNAMKSIIDKNIDELPNNTIIINKI
jgi:ribonuclease HI